MPYFVDEATGRVTVTLSGAQPPRGLISLPHEACEASRLRNGQLLTKADVSTLRDGRALGESDDRAWLPPDVRWEHKVLQIPTFKVDRAEAIRSHLSALSPHGWEVVSMITPDNRVLEHETILIVLQRRVTAADDFERRFRAEEVIRRRVRSELDAEARHPDSE